MTMTRVRRALGMLGALGMLRASRLSGIAQAGLGWWPRAAGRHVTAAQAWQHA